MRGGLASPETGAAAMLGALGPSLAVKGAPAWLLGLRRRLAGPVHLHGGAVIAAGGDPADDRIAQGLVRDVGVDQRGDRSGPPVRLDLFVGLGQDPEVVLGWLALLQVDEQLVPRLRRGQVRR